MPGKRAVRQHMRSFVAPKIRRPHLPPPSTRRPGSRRSLGLLLPGGAERRQAGTQGGGEVSNLQPRSRRRWEYLFRERRNDGYDLAYPFCTDQTSSAPAVLRDPYTADA